LTRLEIAGGSNAESVFRKNYSLDPLFSLKPTRSAISPSSRCLKLIKSLPEAHQVAA
jgi:hypothetical protein